MSENFSELDEMMGYGAENLSEIFKTGDNAPKNSNIYRTNPKNTVAEDGHYHAKLRLLYNAHNRKRTIVHSATYNLHDQDGFFTVPSLLGENDPNSPYFANFKKCPLFVAWKKLHFSKDTSMVDFAAEVFNKNEADYIMVQIVEDKNQPDMVGKIMPWKLPKAVREKLEGKMNPSKDSGKTPVNMLDYLTGRILDVDVKPGPEDKQHPERYFREIKYDLCEFDTEVSPITKIDGTPLFTDDEIATIEKYDEKCTKIAKMKSPEERTAAYDLLKANKLYTEVRNLMQRAYEYVKENSKDLVEEVGYKPWDEETTARVNSWIKIVLTGKDPAEGAYSPDGEDIDAMFAQGKQTVSEAPDPMEGFDSPSTPDSDDDLPF